MLLSSYTTVILFTDGLHAKVNEVQPDKEHVTHISFLSSIFPLRHIETYATTVTPPILFNMPNHQLNQTNSQHLHAFILKVNIFQQHPQFLQAFQVFITKEFQFLLFFISPIKSKISSTLSCSSIQ